MGISCQSVVQVLLRGIFHGFNVSVPTKRQSANQHRAFSNLTATVLLDLFGVFLIIFPEPLIRLFIDDPKVVASGAISYGFVAYALGMVLVQGLNGSGDTVTPTKINLFCFWMIEIPLAYLLAIVFDLKIYGICIAIVAAETMLTLTAWYFFRRGKWKTMKV